MLKWLVYAYLLCSLLTSLLMRPSNSLLIHWTISTQFGILLTWFLQWVFIHYVFSQFLLLMRTQRTLVAILWLWHHSLCGWSSFTSSDYSDQPAISLIWSLLSSLIWDTSCWYCSSQSLHSVMPSSVCHYLTQLMINTLPTSLNHLDLHIGWHLEILIQVNLEALQLG